MFLLSLALYKIASGDAFFIPLSKKTIREMLKLANIRKNDVLYDLGCGTGKVVITASKDYGIKTVGIEKNRILAWMCRRNVRRNNIEYKIRIIQNDFMKEDLRKADVVVLYLTKKMNERVRPKLERELKKGTRVVSADHTFDGWKEIRRIRTGHFYTHLYKI